jgi:hypothetical protein
MALFRALNRPGKLFVSTLFLASKPLKIVSAQSCKKSRANVRFLVRLCDLGLGIGAFRSS